MVAWIIIWGTKVRNRFVGLRADFCGECLRVSRFNVNKVETVGHLYYIPLGSYVLKAVTGECQTCGSQRVLNTSDCENVVSKHEAEQQSILELTKTTNPGLLQELSGIARQIETRIPVAQRDRFLFNHFCARQSQHFQEAEHHLSGWLGLVLIVFLVAAGFVFGVVGTVPGIVASVGLVVALFVIRHWAIQRYVAKRVRPQIARFLTGTGLAWAQLEEALDSGDLRYPRLRRHFKRAVYDQFRQEWNPDELLDNGNCDIIVPVIDDEAERIEAERFEAERLAAEAARKPAASDATAETAASNWKIVKCLQCGMSVIPKANGTCPSCQAAIAGIAT